MNVRFKQEGWFTKFYKFSIGLNDWETPTKNGCAFFWNSIIAILLLPFTWWNVLTDKLTTDPSNGIILRALLGLFCYAGYALFCIVGYGLFVSGANSEGEVYGYLLNLIHIDSVNSFWLFLILPFCAIITILLGFGIIVGIVSLIAFLVQWISEYTYKDKFEYRKIYDDEGNHIRTDRIEKTNTLKYIYKMFIAIKNKICPIIEWE